MLPLPAAPENSHEDSQTLVSSSYIVIYSLFIIINFYRAAGGASIADDVGTGGAVIYQENFASTSFFLFFGIY